LKSTNQLLITGLFLVLSLFGWYSLGWDIWFYISFLTVMLMMMIYKELSSQQDKDRFLVLLLSLLWYFWEL
jgi:POT family proton-dependent oligopeptide transporter